MRKRRTILINPGLQLKFIVSFTCLAAAAVMFEAIVVNRMLIRLTDKLPGAGGELLPELNSILMGGVGYTLLLLIPIAAALGVVATFRVAGPLYAIKRYLNRIAQGESVGECTIRERDELHDLCEAVNLAVGALRADGRPHADSHGDEPAALLEAS